MSEIKKNRLQRISITIHLISLPALVCKIMTGDQLGSWFQIVAGTFLGLWMLTFYFSFNRTGLFNFTHTKVKNLDERELEVSRRALRFAYSVFSIVAVLLLFCIALTSLKVGVLMAAAMLYLAHVLPAVYLGWTGEKR